MKTTNLQTYNNYKPSGMEWLGEIPEHWEVKKIFHFFKAEKGKKAALLTKDYCGKIKGKYPVYSGQTENNGIMSSINEYEFDFSTDGCLFSTTVGAKAMSVNYLKDKFSLSQNCMIIIKRNSKVLNKFFYYQFQPIFNFHRSLIPDHMQASFRMEDLYQFKFFLPSISEQTAIAKFLDDKTAKIDQAITIKKNQIELLKERRQILIHKAVTRGLNDNVKLKDSGVEWIGEIPEHWELSPLRHLGKTQNGISKGGEHFGTGFPFVSYGDVYKDIKLPLLVNGLVESTIEDRKQYSVLEGDILFTRTSETVEEIGFSSTCMQTIENATFAGFLIRFRPQKNKLNKEFSKYYFSSSTHRAFFVKEMNLVIRASLSQDLLKRMPVLLPPLSEQEEIGNYLNNTTTKIATAISLKEKEIEKLKEYKASLINSAVTGKIKVF